LDVISKEEEDNQTTGEEMKGGYETNRPPGLILDRKKISHTQNLLYMKLIFEILFSQKWLNVPAMCTQRKIKIH